MAELSKRLQIIASLVPQGKSVCDVGTDHGYLPAVLYLSGKYTKVSATDIREKPLENARNGLNKCGADGVRLVLCDGLEKIPKQDAQTVIIAGMGGDVISGIIDRCPYRDNPLFILQPMTKADVLREYLAKNGFNVLYETALTENGKIYSIMTAKFDGKIRKLPLSRLKTGALKPDTAENKAYIKKQADICSKCIRDLENVSGKEELTYSLKKAYKEIVDLLEGK